MDDRFDQRARRVMAVARQEARRLGHAHLGTEHLLLGLLAEVDGAVAGLLRDAGATLEGARSKVAEAVPAGRHPSGPGSATAAASATATNEDELPLTARARRAIDRATRFSLQRHETEVRTEHLLRGVLDVEGTAGQVLRGLGVDVPALSARLERLADEPPPAATAAGSSPPATVVSGPRCPACGTDLSGSLGHRIVDGAGRPFVVAYCLGCGSALGATPA